MRKALALLAVVFIASMLGLTQVGRAESPSQAGPSASVIASLTANVPIAAGGGWILWSAPDGNGWQLVGSHAGATAALPAGPRSKPFDVSVGSDRRGSTVATFSRCSVDPPVTAGLGLALIDPTGGRGCRVHVLDLATGQETVPKIPQTKGSSDTTPAIWHGQIAFGRVDAAHALVGQVELWRPAAHRLVTLPHGALPNRCPYKRGCAGERRAGLIQGLAYDGPVVSFLWQPQAPGVIGDAGWEVRADLVATGHSTLVGSGYAGEVCTGGTDLAEPGPPLLAGTTVTFPALESACYTFNSVFSQVDARPPVNARFGPLPSQTVGLARDGRALYALTAPTPPSDTNPTCTPAAPCALQQVSVPPLQAQRHTPTSPFFD